MKKNLTLFTFFLLFFISDNSYAWGLQGHRIIGKMSEKMISCKAKKKINDILGGASIAMVSNWGDFVKPDSCYDKYRDWHYTNIAANVSRQEFDLAAMKLDKGEAIYRSIYLVDYLKKNPNDVDMLKLLIHIIGDIYQPLHLGRNEDKGGNTIYVKWFGVDTRLHYVWDNAVIDYEKLSYTEYADYLISTHKPKRPKFSKQLLLDNAWSTYQVAQDIYRDQDKVSDSYSYIYSYEKVWEMQMVKAAQLLAAVLDYIY